MDAHSAGSPLRRDRHEHAARVGSPPVAYATAIASHAPLASRNRAGTDEVRRAPARQASVTAPRIPASSPRAM